MVMEIYFFVAFQLVFLWLNNLCFCGQISSNWDGIHKTMEKLIVCYMKLSDSCTTRPQNGQKTGKITRVLHENAKIM